MEWFKQSCNEIPGLQPREDTSPLLCIFNGLNLSYDNTSVIHQLVYIYKNNILFALNTLIKKSNFIPLNFI